MLLRCREAQACCHYAGMSASGILPAARPIHDFRYIEALPEIVLNHVIATESGNGAALFRQQLLQPLPSCQSSVDRKHKNMPVGKPCATLVRYVRIAAAIDGYLPFGARHDVTAVELIELSVEGDQRLRPQLAQVADLFGEPGAAAE